VLERRLRRHCRSLLRDLDIRPPLDLAELCTRLADHRGKPIHLAAFPFPVPGSFGVWLATSRADHIFYQQETSRAHPIHIALHEIGHLLADHRSNEQDDDLIRMLYPGPSPETLRSALRRTSYGTEQETAAETVATIILQWASVLDTVVPRLSSASTGEQRMRSALGDQLIAVHGIVLYLAVAWKAYHLSRAPRDQPLRWVTACLICAALAYPAGIVAVARPASAAAPWLTFAELALLLGTGYTLSCFFLFSLRPAPTARVQTRLRAVPFAVIIGVLAISAALTPAGARVNDLTIPAVAGSYLAFDVCISCLLADAWLLAREGARRNGTAEARPADSSRWPGPDGGWREPAGRRHRLPLDPYPRSRLARASSQPAGDPGHCRIHHRSLLPGRRHECSRRARLGTPPPRLP